MALSFQTIVEEEVRRRGRVSFAEFMEWTLYHPRHGYYTSAVRTGRRGDFYTNAQTGGLFGDLLAEFFVSLWDQLGSQRWTLVELGAGDGSLAESVLRGMESRGRSRRLSLHVVERSPVARAAARRRLSRFPHVHFHPSLDEMEHTAGVEGCVYSNEFFDACPFHRLRWTEGRWQELWVQWNGAALEERLGPLSAEAGTVLLEGAPEEGWVIEWAPVVEGTINEISRILSRGYVLSIDYGGATDEIMGPHRPSGTRRTFRSHRVDDRPFENIGRNDITAHVNFDLLKRWGDQAGLTALTLQRQGAFLLSVGATRLRAYLEEATDEERPRRARHIQHLIHPHGLGDAFRVLIQGKEAPPIQSKIFLSS